MQDEVNASLSADLIPFLTAGGIRGERKFKNMNNSRNRKAGLAGQCFSCSPQNAGRMQGFTLIEILIVISIIAILASTIIPNFVGFDAEARVSATRTNLESIRTRINLFRAKEGRYPDSLGELTTTTYNDVGVKKAYLRKIPSETISSSRGNNDYADQTQEETLGGTGGWIYFTDTAEVKVNVAKELGRRWGDYADEIPSEW